MAKGASAALLRHLFLASELLIRFRARFANFNSSRGLWGADKRRLANAANRFSSLLVGMIDPLSHIHSKLGRAKAHIHEIHSLCQSFLQSDFYALSPDMDRQHRFVLRFGEVKPFPDAIPILIGECVHHLRSSLDHLMWILAKPLKGKETDVQFPLVSSKKKFAGTKRNMPGVPRGVRGAVESVQPYHRRKLPQTRFLGNLQAINNWDKHRIPLLSVAAFETARMRIEIVDGVGELVSHELFRGRVETGAIVARIKPTGYWTAGTKVHPHPTFQFLPVFDDSMPKQVAGTLIYETLCGAGDFIENHHLPLFKRSL
jgi:hypothetical protein